MEESIMTHVIAMDKLKQKMENNGDVKLIEVLKPEKYKEKHIKGAINIPLDKIASEAKERFQPEDELIVYCSDFECTASPTAAEKLESIGFKNVYDYQGGKKEWAEADYPME